MPSPLQSPSQYSDASLPDGSNTQVGFNQAIGATSVNDPSTARRLSLGMPDTSKAGQVFNFNFMTSTRDLAPEVDWRVRISMQPATAALFYNDPNNRILNPLVATSGLVFPYTPAITLRHNANYNPTKLTHSNYASYFYEGSEVSQIDINAEFTIQNVAEGQYLMAAIHFMRACTKMFYGNSQLAGTPPPMVFLDGYGPSYLPHVPCVITSFSHTMPAEIDYMQIPIGVDLSNIAGNAFNTGSNMAQMTALPTSSTLSINLQPVYSRTNVAQNFTLERFTQGGLIQNSVSPRGGFL